MYRDKEKQWKVILLIYHEIIKNLYLADKMHLADLYLFQDLSQLSSVEPEWLKTNLIGFILNDAIICIGKLVQTSHNDNSIEQFINRNKINKKFVSNLKEMNKKYKNIIYCRHKLGAHADTIWFTEYIINKNSLPFTISDIYEFVIGIGVLLNNIATENDLPLFSYQRVISSFVKNM